MDTEGARSKCESEASEQGSYLVVQPEKADLASIVDSNTDAMRLVGFPLPPKGYEPLYCAWVRMWISTHGASPVDPNIVLRVSKLTMLIQNYNYDFPIDGFSVKLKAASVASAEKALVSLKERVACATELIKTLEKNKGGFGFTVSAYTAAVEKQDKLQEDLHAQIAVIQDSRAEYDYAVWANDLISEVEGLLGFAPAKTYAPSSSSSSGIRNAMERASLEPRVPKLLENVTWSFHGPGTNEQHSRPASNASRRVNSGSWFKPPAKTPFSIPEQPKVDKFDSIDSSGASRPDTGHTSTNGSSSYNTAPKFNSIINGNIGDSIDKAECD
ncbi:hypothetical protein GGF46_002326 [Coemansia sp. RSA 552]|nr:hypothetical protein GGF46_002326 [Coemansia sp. RSA 552]